ncbi:MAG: hypothetical protein ACKV2T_19040 [Kofleriaceae bacterium]
MKRAALLALVVVAACEPPQPTIDLQLSAGPSQECPSTDCNDIAMSCRMFMSIRILSPDDQTAPLHSECLPIPMTIAGTLCPIGGLELQPHTLPYRDLEVQVAIYPKEVVVPPTDENPFYQCPVGTTYDFFDGFPVSEPDKPTPALGGRGYYRPGDEVIQITLGCSNLEELANDQCEGVASVSVTAIIDDFDTHLSVSAMEAQRLDVRVGQPRASGPGYVLETMDLTQLVDTPAAAPAWAGTVGELFTTHACLTVRDDAPQSTTSVTCKTAMVTDSNIELTGANASARLSKTSLDQILAALSLTQFPASGLTVGVVIEGGAPLAGQTVTVDVGTIEYLSADRSSTGGSATSGGAIGGVFVSRDAPFGARFTTNKLGTTARKIGGLVQNKVTIVVLDLSEPGTEP